MDQIYQDFKNSLKENTIRNNSLIREIKDKAFDALYNYYNAQLGMCNLPTRKESEKKMHKYHDEMIWRIQDYESAMYDIEMDLNYDDYVNIKKR